MNIVIINDAVYNWDNYSIKEKLNIAYKLAAISNKLLNSRIRLIKSMADLKESDSDTIKNAIKYIGKEIVSPQQGIIVGIEETLEDYYYVIQAQEDIEYISICVKLTFK